MEPLPGEAALDDNQHDAGVPYASGPTIRQSETISSFGIRHLTPSLERDHVRDLDQRVNGSSSIRTFTICRGRLSITRASPRTSAPRPPWPALPKARCPRWRDSRDRPAHRCAAPLGLHLHQLRPVIPDSRQNDGLPMPRLAYAFSHVPPFRSALLGIVPWNPTRRMRLCRATPPANERPSPVRGQIRNTARAHGALSAVSVSSEPSVPAPGAISLPDTHTPKTRRTRTEVARHAGRLVLGEPFHDVRRFPEDIPSVPVGHDLRHTTLRIPRLRRLRDAEEDLRFCRIVVDHRPVNGHVGPRPRKKPRARPGNQRAACEGCIPRFSRRIIAPPIPLSTPCSSPRAIR